MNGTGREIAELEGLLAEVKSALRMLDEVERGLDGVMLPPSHDLQEVFERFADAADSAETNATLTSPFALRG